MVRKVVKYCSHRFKKHPAIYDGFSKKVTPCCGALWWFFSMDKHKVTQLVTKRVVLQVDGVSIVRSWSSLSFHWLFCIKNSIIGACSELVWLNLNNEQPISVYCGPLGMSKRVWPWMIWCTMFFVQTLLLPPSMHQKYTKYGGSFMQKHQLLTDSYVEFEDNSKNIFISERVCPAHGCLLIT